MDNQHALPAFDLALALQRANGSQALVDELQGILRSDLKVQGDAMDMAGRSGDLTRLYEIAHKIHGGSLYCGNPALEEATFELEKALREDKPFQSALQATLSAIDELLLMENV